jgi:hypothetical protein
MTGWALSQNGSGGTATAASRLPRRTVSTRVGHFMNKFRRLGFIDYNGHLEIHSSLLSVVLHDKPQIAADRDSGAPM